MQFLDNLWENGFPKLQLCKCFIKWSRMRIWEVCLGGIGCNCSEVSCHCTKMDMNKQVLVKQKLGTST